MEDMVSIAVPLIVVAVLLTELMVTEVFPFVVADIPKANKRQILCNVLF